MTGTLYGEAQFHWVNGFVFGAVLAALASVIVYNFCKAPTVEQMRRAVAETKEVPAGASLS